MNTNKLKPCPFCGGTAEIEHMGTPRRSMVIACVDCGCSLETGDTNSFDSKYWSWNDRSKRAEEKQTDCEWWFLPRIDRFNTEAMVQSVGVIDGYLGEGWTRTLANALLKAKGNPPLKGL